MVMEVVAAANTGVEKVKSEEIILQRLRKIETKLFSFELKQKGTRTLLKKRVLMYENNPAFC